MKNEIIGWPLNNALFKIKECETYYLLTIDLTSLVSTNLSIELSKERLRLIEESSDPSESDSILFQYDSLQKQVKARFHEGVISMELPKNALSDVLGIPRLRSAIAEGETHERFL